MKIIERILYALAMAIIAVIEACAGFVRIVEAQETARRVSTLSTSAAQLRWN